MQKLELTSYDPNFIDQLWKWRNQPTSLRHNPIQPVTKEDFKKRCESIPSDLNKLYESEKLRWYLKLNGELVGHIGMTINQMMMIAEIGYAVDEEKHGRGIATQAVREFAKMIFSKTKIRKLTACVHDKNIASIKVLEKVGFKREGLLREQFLIHGSPVDEIVYGLLRHEVNYFE